MGRVLGVSLFPLLLSSLISLTSQWSLTHLTDVNSEIPKEILLNRQELDSHITRSKRYVLRKKRWSKNVLKWRLEKKLITDGDEFIVRNTLHRAFNDWSSVSSVRFEEIFDPKQDVDIEVAFEKGIHADSFPFDGPDGIVAHAFYPRDGRLHFDADENWTLNQVEGVNLYQTALHEVGHLLGLEHSSDPRAAMFGSKRPYDPSFQLSDDDVRAVRILFPLRKKIMHTLIEIPIPVEPLKGSKSEKGILNRTPISTADSALQEDVIEGSGSVPSLEESVDWQSTLWPEFLTRPSDAELTTTPLSHSQSVHEDTPMKTAHHRKKLLGFRTKMRDPIRVKFLQTLL